MCCTNCNLNVCNCNFCPRTFKMHLLFAWGTRHNVESLIVAALSMHNRQLLWNQRSRQWGIMRRPILVQLWELSKQKKEAAFIQNTEFWFQNFFHFTLQAYFQMQHIIVKKPTPINSFVLISISLWQFHMSKISNSKNRHVCLGFFDVLHWDTETHKKLMIRKSD